jgi:8-oxo-dGTP pyrophosphatase MutT (NUDIX family)
MIRYSNRLVLHIAAAVALLGSASWLASTLSWEPALALLAALGAYSGTLAAVLRDQFRYGQSRQTAKMALSDHYDANCDFVQPSILSLVEKGSGHSDDTERFLAGAYGVLFRRLKIVDIDERGELRPVSERAGLFLRTLAYTAGASVPFCGDWRAEGAQNDEARRLGDILSRIEEYRISASGGISTTAPARDVSSSLVLVKAMKGSEPVFLLRWSGAWGGYFWFVGGIQSPSDTTAAACARRELKEELGLGESVIQNLTQFASVKDRRISGRQHYLTDYTYSLFSVAIDDQSPSGAVLLATDFSVHKTVPGGYQVSQRCKWHTWNEITASVELNRDAAQIIGAIKAFGINRIPLSLRPSLP